MRIFSRLILSLLLLSGCKTAGKFAEKDHSTEGTLVYHISIKAKRAATDLHHVPGIPDTICYTYKKDCYLIRHNGTSPKGYTIYKGKENRLYHFTNSEGMLLCSIQDAGEDLDFKLLGKAPQLRTSDSLFDISGQACRKISLIWHAGSSDYFYRPNYLYMKPEYYAEHHYDGWSAYLKLARALPVRIVKRDPSGMEIIFDLIEFRPQYVSNHDFDIPEMEPLDILQPPSIGSKQLYKVKTSSSGK